MELKVSVNDNPHLPLYQQLAASIEEEINSGELNPGQRIPSENELCEMYHISRTTVRQALSDLAMRGKLIRVKGRGTFVPKFVARKPFDGLTGFTKEVKYLYKKNSSSKVLIQETILPNDQIAQLLGLKPDEAVIKLQRARYIQDLGIAGIDTRYLPFSRFGGLLNEDLEKNSLYDILGKKYNTHPTRAYSEVKGSSCPEDIAALLEINPGDPVTFFRDVIYDQNEIPFDFGENYYRVDRYTYRVEIFQNKYPMKQPNL